MYTQIDIIIIIIWSRREGGGLVERSPGSWVIVLEQGGTLCGETHVAGSSGSGSGSGSGSSIHHRVTVVVVVTGGGCRAV